ncbi:hypothetical protein C8R47DRAFT_1077536 [Mycena vitilis]|nr:hypothetical protein C8R47DRAFT_1077536 [Mycena vitilis]
MHSPVDVHSLVSPLYKSRKHGNKTWTMATFERSGGLEPQVGVRERRGDLFTVEKEDREAVYAGVSAVTVRRFPLCRRILVDHSYRGGVKALEWTLKTSDPEKMNTGSPGLPLLVAKVDRRLQKEPFRAWRVRGGVEYIQLKVQTKKVQVVRSAGEISYKFRISACIRAHKKANESFQREPGAKGAVESNEEMGYYNGARL